MLTTAVRFIQHQLGHPASLNALLDTTLDLGYGLELPPTAGTSTSSITCWYDWRPAGWDVQPGELRGWQRVHGQYQGVANSG